MIYKLILKNFKVNRNDNFIRIYPYFNQHKIFEHILNNISCCIYTLKYIKNSNCIK